MLWFKGFARGRGNIHSCQVDYRRLQGTTGSGYGDSSRDSYRAFHSTPLARLSLLLLTTAAAHHHRPPPPLNSSPFSLSNPDPPTAPSSLILVEPRHLNTVSIVVAATSSIRVYLTRFRRLERPQPSPSLPLLDNEPLWPDPPTTRRSPLAYDHDQKEKKPTGAINQGLGTRGPFSPHLGLLIEL